MTTQPSRPSSKSENPRLTVAVLTVRGSGRSVNQDRIVVNRQVIASEHSQTIVMPFAVPGLVCVLDGLGGHPAGDIAAGLAADRIASHTPRTPDDIAAAVDDANRFLYRTMFDYPSLATMGATVAGVLVEPDRATVFWVGDSRVYFHRGGSLALMSVDDWADGYITQTLGGWERHHPVDCHISVEPWAGEPIVVATDGMFGMFVEPDELGEAMEGPPATAPDRLLQVAVRSGNTDDCSIAVIGPT